jgi:antagonist of KipI
VGVHGPDLEELAVRMGRPPADFVAAHSAVEYLVQAVGFSPGFPYLGGLPAELAAPRRSTPRPRVPAGSVGIGGTQTGIYPIETPGGWNLVGRTPRRLFDPAREEPALLRLGDRVRFVPVEAGEFVGPDGEPAPLPESPASGALRVRRAGMFTTVQDLGREGWREQGVPVSGAADAAALRVANLVVGNPEGAAGLEFTLVGPELEFGEDAVVALGGAEAGGLPRWQPLTVRAGESLRLGALAGGCRGYLAISGGIAVRPVLGSRSTFTRAGLGGWCGRVLRDGDVLPIGPGRRALPGGWRVDPRMLPGYTADAEVRVVAGDQAPEFLAPWAGATFRVSRLSDRMGVRLEGGPVLRRAGGELLSAPVTPGTVQVPPDGNPIVLLADAQTVGGYPRIAHVATVDLPLVAQLRPGDRVRFREISLAEARALAVAREHSLRLLREGVRGKLA